MRSRPKRRPTETMARRKRRTLRPGRRKPRTLARKRLRGTGGARAPNLRSHPRRGGPPIRYNRAFRIHSECHERRSQSPADRPAPDRAEERRAGSRRHPILLERPKQASRRLCHQPRAAARQTAQAQPARARRPAARRAAALEAGRQGPRCRRRLHQLHARRRRQDRGGARGAGEGRGFRPRGGRRHQVQVGSSPPTRPARSPRRPRRGAAYGASLSDVLAFAGYEVSREYYVNDAGRQMDILALSTWLRYLAFFGIEIPLPAQRLPGRLRESTWVARCATPTRTASPRSPPCRSWRTPGLPTAFRIARTTRPSNSARNTSTR